MTDSRANQGNSNIRRGNPNNGNIRRGNNSNGQIRRSLILLTAILLPSVVASSIIPALGEDVDLSDFPFPVPTPVPPCEDKFGDCPSWAMAPYYFCEPSKKYHNFMMDYCRKACGVCIDVSDKYPPPPSPTEPEVVVEIEVDPCAGVYCDPIPCMEDEVWSDPEGACCGTCVKTPKAGCSPVFKKVSSDSLVHEGAVCRTLDLMVTSSCFGVCASSTLLVEGVAKRECACCAPDTTKTLSVRVECYPPETPLNPVPTAYLTEYEYEVVESCKCGWTQCDKDTWTPPLIDEAIMDNYYDMNRIVQNFNDMMQVSPDEPTDETSVDLVPLAE